MGECVVRMGWVARVTLLKRSMVVTVCMFDTIHFEQHVDVFNADFRLRIRTDHMAPSHLLSSSDKVQ
jgi:hypothetical protein